MKEKSNKVYIYNQRQINFYLSKGLVPIQIGTGKYGETFAVFTYKDHVSMMGEWMQIKDEYMLSN